MTYIPDYSNVHPIRARKITADNSVFAPASHDGELAEAAPFWTDENKPTRVDAPQWQWRDGNGRIIRAFPPLKSQSEIDDEFRGPGVAVWLWMGATATTAALIMAGFDWLVGAM